jgi:hypothetical protein
MGLDMVVQAFIFNWAKRFKKLTRINIALYRPQLCEMLMPHPTTDSTIIPIRKVI